MQQQRRLATEQRRTRLLDRDAADLVSSVRVLGDAGVVTRRSLRARKAVVNYGMMQVGACSGLWSWSEETGC